MKVAFEGFDDTLIVASVSPWLMERASRSPILEGKHHCVVYNGLNTDVFKYYDTADLRKNIIVRIEKLFSMLPQLLVQILII